MIENSESSKPKLSDQEALQQSIAAINGSLARSLRSTLFEILVLLAAVTLGFSHGKTSDHSGTALVASSFILLVVVSRGYEIVRYRQIKVSVAKQSEIAAKQRVRADKLYGLSIIDPLTGLHNRRFGEQRLKEEIARSERGGDTLAILLFDLDYFKEINDKSGHAMGDLALKEFSRRLRRAIRACDVPVRMGGDEFLVILPECPREKVDVILSRIGTPEIELNGENLSICYSTGRAQYQYSDTIETLLGRADEVLYAAKVARPTTLKLAKSTVEPIPTEAQNANLRDRHALRLAEVNWGRP